MAGKLKNPSKNLNPNWAQLLEKLKSNGSKNQFSRHSNRLDTENQKSILGKRKERSDEDSEASKPNPLLPTSSDCSLTDVVAMDCEMVGVGSLGNKSALGRVTLVNKWGNVIYDEHVRPVEYVVDFRTEISGIRPQDLKKDHRRVLEKELALETDRSSHSRGFNNLLPLYAVLLSFPAKNFNVVQKKVAEMIKGKVLVGHALRNDLKALLLTHPKKDIRDSSEYAPFLKEGRSRSLKNLAAQFLDVEIQNGEHCPVSYFSPHLVNMLTSSQIEDARAAMMLYQKNMKPWERSVKDFIRHKENKKKRGNRKKKFKDAEGLTGNISTAAS
ncbi:hypothetical protein ACJIZ3_007133 [Penstemon smallii]|uniref:RNA exonuclease 4 n=1 Tax=Penstemon smallii TaxID=265156 RepID=A0ABD3S9M9_9LAMI